MGVRFSDRPRARKRSDVALAKRPGADQLFQILVRRTDQPEIGCELLGATQVGGRTVLEDIDRILEIAAQNGGT